mmetsp:Transcript_31237/g.72238  ORF Transcript_31237/g.72238 Transcript_31237/m.72238 type:complete len:330 (-) Transcript_31237:2420-3409(-)
MVAARKDIWLEVLLAWSDFRAANVAFPTRGGDLERVQVQRRLCDLIAFWELRGEARDGRLTTRHSVGLTVFGTSIDFGAAVESNGTSCGDRKPMCFGRHFIDHVALQILWRSAQIRLDTASHGVWSLICLALGHNRGAMIAGVALCRHLEPVNRDACFSQLVTVCCIRSLANRDLLAARQGVRFQVFVAHCGSRSALVAICARDLHVKDGNSQGRLCEVIPFPQWKCRWDTFALVFDAATQRVWQAFFANSHLCLALVATLARRRHVEVVGLQGFLSDLVARGVRRSACEGFQAARQVIRPHVRVTDLCLGFTDVSWLASHPDAEVVVP